VSRSESRLVAALLLAAVAAACSDGEPGRTAAPAPAALPADHPPPGGGAPAPPRLPAETVLATVDGRPVTAGDVDAALAAMPAADRLEYVAPEMIRDLVESLVDRTLQAAAARDEGVPVEAWLERELGRAGEPTDREVADYYAAHRAGFRVPARVRVTRVTAAARPVAERLRAELARGAAADDLRARAARDGYAVEQLWLQDVPGEPALAKVAVGLPAGAVSDVLAVPAGFAVLRADEHVAPSERPLTEVGAGIRARLADQRRQAAAAELRQRLRKDAGIILNPATLAAYLPPAAGGP
jgi:hypothetical protein